MQHSFAKTAKLIWPFFGNWFCTQHIGELICSSEGLQTGTDRKYDYTGKGRDYSMNYKEKGVKAMKADVLKMEELLAGFSSIGIGLLLLNIFIDSLDTNSRRCHRNLLIAVKLEVSEVEQKGGTENTCSGKNMNIHRTK